MHTTPIFHPSRLAASAGIKAPALAVYKHSQIANSIRQHAQSSCNISSLLPKNSFRQQLPSHCLRFHHSPFGLRAVFVHLLCVFSHLHAQNMSQNFQNLLPCLAKCDIYLKIGWFKFSFNYVIDIIFISTSTFHLLIPQINSSNYSQHSHLYKILKFKFK